MNFIAIVLLFSNTLNARELKEAKAFTQEMNKMTPDLIQSFNADDCLPTQDKGKEFDGKHAKEQLDTCKIAEIVEISPHNPSEHIHEDEYYFSRSDAATKENSNTHFDTTIFDYEEEQCEEADAPFSVTINRTLNVDVIHHPEEHISSKICQGHSDKKKHYWKSDAEKEKAKQEKRLSKDPSIQTYKVKISKGGWTSDYVVKWTWTHIHDASPCNDYKTSITALKPESWEERDRWVDEENLDQSIVETQQCTFIKKTCLDSTPCKSINGRNIARQCWNETLLYACRLDSKNKCEFLKKKNCILSYKTCIRTSDYGCALWRMMFKCASRKRETNMDNLNEAFSPQQDEYAFAPDPNTSFSSVITTITLFDELKKDLESQQISDATKIQLFRGKKSQCAKSVAENAMYDCCFSYDGLANQVKLSKCTSEEIALAEMRSKGLCHYVGSYEEKFLDLWKSRKEHVYCCFPTKLSRVFQEQARNQLKLDWGTPRHPDCRGLSQEEIQRLNFSTLDLSEAFEMLPSQQKLNQQQSEMLTPNKVQQLEERLKNKISNMNSGARHA